MPTTVFVYDARDFVIDFKNGDGTTIHTSAPTADRQDSGIANADQVISGTLSMGGTQANIGTLDMTFESAPIDTAVENSNSGTVTTGKTLFGDTVIATGEDVDFIYEIRIYDPANPGTQIYLYAIGRADTYNGAPEDDHHEIIGFVSKVPLDKNITYMVGDIYDNTEQGVRENLIDETDLTPEPGAPVCFAAGTMIKTDRGEVAIEDLRVGDRVYTVDHGYQPVRWIHSRYIDGATLSFFPKMRPIRICKDALSPGVPSRDLVVSPQHHILVQSKIAERMFGAFEVLVAAKKLCAMDGIYVAQEATEVTYFHIAFDSHQIVIADGVQAESFYPGPEAVKSLAAQAAMDELLSIFPQIATDNADFASARYMVPGNKANKLAQRHYSNRKALQSRPALMHA